MKKSLSPASIILTLSFVIVVLFIGFILWDASPRSMVDTTDSTSNIEIRDGVQYITIMARGGYKPQATNAQAGMPTKLLVETNNTYDCSLALVVSKVGYRDILPSNGTTEIDL